MERNSMSDDGCDYGLATYLVCACCGAATWGRQWSNRDTGYGACTRCADANTAEYGEGDPTTSEYGGMTTWALYGERGVHFDIEEG